MRVWRRCFSLAQGPIKRNSRFQSRAAGAISSRSFGTEQELKRPAAGRAFFGRRERDRNCLSTHAARFAFAGARDSRSEDGLRARLLGPLARSALDHESIHGRKELAPSLPRIRRSLQYADRISAGRVMASSQRNSAFTAKRERPNNADQALRTSNSDLQA